MKFQEFSSLYKRGEDIYNNFIGMLTCMYRNMLKLGSKATKQDRECMDITQKFLKDFYSIDDTNVVALEEFDKITQLDIVYNDALISCM